MTDVSELIERVARPVMAILWRREQYNGVGPEYENYRESMGGRVASYEKEAEEIARAAIEASGVQSLSERVAVLEGELAYLRGQREHFINALIVDGQVLRDTKEWLNECHGWLMSTDLDMQCPMETDPLDLIDRIDSRHAALTKEGIENG